MIHFFNPFYKPSDTIFVAGAGRSGTTWLGNMIGSSPGFLSLFEPFDYRHVPQLNISSLRLYIRANSPAHYLDETIRDMLLGKIRNNWILSQNHRSITWRILIKEIRANLLLGYLKNRFNSQIVFIVRHPCPTVLSRMELKWETNLEDFLKQQELMDDYLTPFDNLIGSANTDIEKHTIMWCVDNLVPLKQLNRDQFIFCTYETLVANKHAEISIIFNALRLRIPRNLDETISKPTSVSSKKSPILAGGNLLEYWKTRLTRDKIRTILNIVHAFGIDIYTDDIMPNLNCTFLK